MKLLIIGGTAFLGRAITDAALAAGHEVTLFNRGQGNPGLFPKVERLYGDRDGGLAVLQGRRWDGVIDTCGYVPRVVSASAELLRDSVGHYTFISTISVYAGFTQPQDEAAPVGTLADPGVEQITGQTYGPLKALCEDAVADVYGERCTIIRPGLIVGPHDKSDRFTYWPVRVARGGEVLAPCAPTYPVQIIDVRDLAEWSLRMTEARQSGTYNATGPAAPLTIGELLTACQRVTGSDARLTWVPEAFLQEQGVALWTDLPVVAPAEEDGFCRTNCARALAAGLTFRPLAQTIADTLTWDATRPAEQPRANGLSAQREAALLAAWHREQPKTLP